MIFLVLFIICINIISVFCVMPSDNEECQRVTEFFDNYMKSSGHTLKLPKCCDESNKYHHLSCKDGHITEIQLRYNNREESIDFSNFPILPNLKLLLFEGHLFKDGILPSRLFEMSNLKTLQILSSNLSKTPKEISSCSLEKLSVYNNTISEFPNSFMTCKKLKHLDLSRNEGIKNIPDSISELKNLENLYLGMTGLTSVSEEIFKLSLNDFDLDGNKDLSIKIYNFGKKVEKCDFRNTNIICYEPDTCGSFVIQDSPRVYRNDTNNVYQVCDSSLKSLGNKKVWVILPLVLLVILLCILCILLCCCFRNNRKKEEKPEHRIKNDIYIPPIAPVNNISTSFIHKIESSNSSIDHANNKNNENNSRNCSMTNTSYSSLNNSNINLNNFKSGINGISIIPIANIGTDPLNQPTLPLSGVEMDTSIVPPSSDINLSSIPNVYDNNNSFSIADSTIDNINTILPVTNLPSFKEPFYQSTKQYDSILITNQKNSKLEVPSQSSIIWHSSTNDISYNEKIQTTTQSPTFQSPSFTLGFDNELYNNISLYYSDLINQTPDITPPSLKQDLSIRPVKSISHSYSNIPSSEDKE